MQINKNLSNINYWVGDGNGGKKQNKFIVIHYVGAVSSAYNNTQYFKSVDRGASANYFVDDSSIWQCVEDSNTAFHCGSDKYFNDARNYNSIGIEMCCFSNNGTLDISEATINNTVELVKTLMNKYGIPLSNIVRHYDVTRKNCPAPFVNDGNRWVDFLNRVNGTVKPITPPELNVGEQFTINDILTVSSIDAKNNLIGILDLTGETKESYHWFDPTPFDVYDVNGNRTVDQVCYVGCKVKLQGVYTVQDRYLTDDWAYYTKIGSRQNWIYSNKCIKYTAPIIEIPKPIVETPKIEPIVEPKPPIVDNQPIIEETTPSEPIIVVNEPVKEVIEEETVKSELVSPKKEKTLFEMIIDFIINLFMKGSK